jgi:SAM-dependent methyltransferase
VLDLGCAGGHLASELRKRGHHVTGSDMVEHDGVRDRVDEFVAANLDQGIAGQVTGEYDVVIAADVLEHVRRPDLVLADARTLLARDGVLLACVPNFGHWYPRARVASGTFAYERRGILDAGHVRFFTRRTFTKLARENGYAVARMRPTGLPFEVLARGGKSNRARASRVLGTVDRVAVAAWPSMFAYQFLAELRPQQ